MSNLPQRSASRRAPTISVSVGCNGDGGVFLGVAEGLTFGRFGETIDLELSGGAAPRFTELAESIRIFRRRFQVLKSKQFVGNWCWNEYDLALIDAAALLDIAIRSKKFTVGAASGDNACDLSDVIDAGQGTIGKLTFYLGIFGLKK